MDHRNLKAAAVLAAAAAATTGYMSSSRAEVVAIDNGVAVKESDVATPRRGMTMSEVSTKFGDPVNKVPGVGKPAISRWEYPGFVVYFENDHVIHSVVANS